MRVNILVILIGFSFWSMGATAQAQNKCSEIKYTVPPGDSKSYRVTRVEGQAIFASPTQKWDLGSVNGLCLSLFNRRNGDLVGAVTSDDRGQFQFANFAPGAFVLIAFAGDSLNAIIPIQLDPPGKARPQRLLLHLREKEDQRKSYVTLVSNLALRKELLALVEQDQKLRNDMIRSGVDHPDKAILARLNAFDSHTTVRMRSIIKKFGWPGADLVGWDGTEAAFILVQHGTHSFQKELLPLMQKKFESGDLAGPNYALFLDRVLVEDGKRQVYGSRAMAFAQWNGEAVLYPIEDEANVDKHRAEVGLSSLAEYRMLLKRMYYPQSK
jgi:hypothetical protein